MYQDAYLQFSAAQAVTASAASTNVIDLGQARDMGAGENLCVDIRVATTCTASGAATVTFQLQIASDAAFSSPIIIEQSDAIPKASLVAGAAIPMKVHRSSPYAPQQYMRLYYVVATGPLTAGAFTAGLTKDVQDAQNTSASGFAVS